MIVSNAFLDFNLAAKYLYFDIVYMGAIPSP